MNITDYIYSIASETPSRLAVVGPEGETTYAEFADLISAATTFFSNEGVERGDRVIVRLVNSLEHLVISLALLRMGATKIEGPLEFGENTKGIVSKFGIKLVVQDPFIPRFDAVRTMPITDDWLDNIRKLKGEVRYDDAQNEPYFIMLTSGSTGVPKGVVTTHKQFNSLYQAGLNNLRDKKILTPGEETNYVLAANLGFAGYFIGTMEQLMAGATVHLLPEFRHSADIVRYLKPFRNWVSFVLPNMCRAFLAHAPSKGLLFPEARALVSMGQPLDEASKNQLLEKVTPNCFDIYGSSTGGLISILTPQQFRTHPTSVGRPIPETKIEIVDENDVALPSGKIGALRLKSEFMASSFFNDEDNVIGQECFLNGWTYTGDLASLDNEGYLYLRGRVGDVVTRGDKRVYLDEVNALLNAMPEIIEASTVVLQDRSARPFIFAFVVSQDSQSQREIVSKCENTLPKIKAPNQMVFLQQLPKLPSGKVDRLQLLKMASNAMNQGEQK